MLLQKWCLIFDSSPLNQFSKFMNFLWVCWFVGKNLSNFVSSWKLNNPYYHNIRYPVHIGAEFFWKFFWNLFCNFVVMGQKWAKISIIWWSEEKKVNNNKCVFFLIWYLFKNFHFFTINTHSAPYVWEQLLFKSLFKWHKYGR